MAISCASAKPGRLSKAAVTQVRFLRTRVCSWVMYLRPPPCQQMEEAILALQRLARSRGERRGRPPAWMNKPALKRRGRPPGNQNKVTKNRH